MNHDLKILLKNALEAYEIWVLEDTGNNSCDDNIVESERQQETVLDNNNEF